MVDEITSTDPSGVSNDPSLTTQPSTLTGTPGVAITAFSTQTAIDTLLAAEEDQAVSLSISGQIELPPGRLSIKEWQETIAEEIQTFKRAVIDAQTFDTELLESFHDLLAEAAKSFEEYHTQLVNTVETWQASVQPQAQQVVDAYDALVIETNTFNDFMQSVWTQDRAAIQDLNAILNTYNNLTAADIQAIYDGLTQPERDALLAGLTPQEITDLGGTEYAVAFQYINQQIANYNQYVAGRPNVQAAITSIIQATVAYNSQVDQYNTVVGQVNVERQTFGLEPIPLFDAASVPDPQPLYVTLPTVSAISPPLLPPDPISTLAVPNSSQKGQIPLPASPGVVPVIGFTDMMLLYYVPLVLEYLEITGILNDALDITYASVNDEIFYLSLRELNLTLPYNYLDTSNPSFQPGANAIGGLGLASSAIGLQSKNLERVLSSALFQEAASNTSLPISGRLFSRLQFTALQLLSKSSLMSSIPGVRFLASRLGTLDAASPAVYGAIALAFAGQIGSLVSTDIARVLVNGQINRLGFYARNRFRASNNDLKQAQRELELAIRSGNPSRIASAVDRAVQAEAQLANATRLLNTFGSLSIGNLAAASNQIAAALNLSLLGVSTAYYARALGIPNLVPLVFAQVSQLPPKDLLIAATPQASLRDVLENPINLVFTKQTLADLLTNRFGFSTSQAAAVVNNAINNLIVSGAGLNTLSSLGNALDQQFRAEGLTPFQAHALGNETAALIRGDLGVQFLNAAFGLNADPSVIAASLVNDLFGIDIGLSGNMLSNAVVRSLQHGGYGSRVRLENELLGQFQGFGLNREDASQLASQFTSFIETLGTAVPLTRFPGLANALLSAPLLGKIAYGQAFAQQEVLNDLQARGLSSGQAAWITDQLQSLASGSYVPASESGRFALTLNGAISRSLAGQDSFQTQREFRNSLRDELSAVGFNRNDAQFLANSAAAFGVTGAFLPVFGIGQESVNAINNSLVDALRSEGVSSSQASLIVQQANEKASGSAPFSSPADFYSILREAVFREAQAQAGIINGNVLFDQAVAAATSSPEILGLSALTERISDSALGILGPDLGGALANRLRDQILASILGGRNAEEIANEEERNPLSIVNLVTDQVKRLRNQEDEAEQVRMLRKLTQMLEKLSVPNAAVGFLITSIGDNPGTFINAVNVSEAGQNYQALQIPT